MLALVPPVISPDASVTLEEFTATVDEFAQHNAAIIIDCVDLRSLSVAAVRMLERASARTNIRLTNASPIVCLLAATYGLAAQRPNGLAR
jgi:hypothetical protein